MSWEHTIGFSYFTFCQAIRITKANTAAFAVDRWTGDDHAGWYGEEVYQGVEDFNNERYSDFSTLLRMEFNEALQYFEDGSVDLLHIDGRHYFEDVQGEFELWRSKLSDRAVVLIHDTNVREREFEVHRFWSDLCKRYFNFNFMHGRGLGVLGVGKHCPPEIAALFSVVADEALTASIREAYARLGGSVALSFRASEALRLQATAQSSATEMAKQVEDLSSLVRQRATDLSDERCLRSDAEGLVTKLKGDLEDALNQLSTELQKSAEQADRLSSMEEIQTTLELSRQQLEQNSRRANFPLAARHRVVRQNVW